MKNQDVQQRHIYFGSFYVFQIQFKAAGLTLTVFASIHYISNYIKAVYVIEIITTT